MLEVTKLTLREVCEVDIPEMAGLALREIARQALCQ